MTQSIVITGATGMIGAAIARSALERNIDVLCIVRKDSTRLENVPKSNRLKIIAAGLPDYAHLDIPGGYDVFYHLAWDKTSGKDRDDTDTQVKNIAYTLDAVRLAKKLGCRKFIGAGSQAEYGRVLAPLTPETPANPESGYGIAKYAAGKLSRLLCSQLGIPFNWVRILSVFGPLDAPQTLIMYAINELLAGHAPEFTQCEQMWDYLYCDDAARAFLAVGERGADGKTYPLGSGQPRKLREYLNALHTIVYPSGMMQFGKKAYYPHQPMYLCADISELTEDTGWKPEVSFEDGIRMTLPLPPTM